MICDSMTQREEVLAALMAGGNMTTAEIGDATGLAATSVTSYLDRLRRTGLVKVVGKQKSTGSAGRNAYIWHATLEKEQS
jgi:predicted ArsR family transcriptional regulator